MPESAAAGPVPLARVSYVQLTSLPVVVQALLLTTFTQIPSAGAWLSEAASWGQGLLFIVLAIAFLIMERRDERLRLA